MGQTDAYVQVYKPKQTDPEQLRIHAYRIAHHPAVEAEVARLRFKSEAKTILSLNDRLNILAHDAQFPGNTPSDRAARARTIEVYNKTAGDNAPERTENTTTIKGDPDAPLAVALEPMTKAEKLAAMRAARLVRRT